MNRYKLLFAALALALCVCLGIAVSSTDAESTAALDSGIYVVTNKSNGNNLNAFDFSYADGGYAYTDSPSGDEGENILLLKQDNGTYLLYPQSEAGKYAYCMDGGKADGRVAKSEQLTDTSYFNITYRDGGYVITNSAGFALGVGEDTLYKKTLVDGAEYASTEEQKWEFTSVDVSSLELKTVLTNGEAKLNSVSAVYAVTKPAYMKNFVEWSSSDESVLLIDTDGTFCALSVGTATVTATLGNVSESIDITVVDEEAFTWYSQHLASSGGWHGGDLSGVYFQSGGSYKRFIINGFNRGLDWMDQGCFLTSIAMVLHNLGARYDAGYDFRFEADGNLEIDPYVAALANSGNRGLTSSHGTLYGNPILISYGQLRSSFTLYGQPVKFTQTYGVTKASLKAALDNHPEGVIVCMQNSYNGTHYVVVTDCINPDAENPNNYRFAIYDASGLKASEGDNVPFELSISYDDMHYRYSNMRSMIVFDIVAEEE